MNQRQPGNLPSDTVQNSKNDGYCLSVTIWSGLSVIDPPLPIDEVTKTNSSMVDETYSMKLDKEIGVDARVGNAVRKIT